MLQVLKFSLILVFICFHCLIATAQSTIEFIDVNRSQDPEIQEYAYRFLRQDYNKVVSNLKTGDMISYNSQIFKLGEYLGGDSATVLLTRWWKCIQNPRHFKYLADEVCS